MHHDPSRAVLRAARATLRATDAPLLLAVSGGLDSMALLHAIAEVGRRRIAAVATFDHGTGRAATAAAAHVARTAAALGLPVVTARGEQGGVIADGQEAAWRRARYRFLRSAAEPFGAAIVTAHTEDDQVETVLMRVMRGSGARGLAALFAPSPIVRPFLGVRRTTLSAFARDRGIRWREDPSNRSMHFLRNRVRHDLLPALRAADPGLEDALLELARRAADWRAGVERFVDDVVRPTHAARGALVVASQELSGYDRDSLAVLWGSLAGRVGLSLDRRGTHRLAAFTISGPRRGSVPLSGGWYLDVRHDAYIIGRPAEVEREPAELPEFGEMVWGSFRFRMGSTDELVGDFGATSVGSWTAFLPSLERATVRAWGAGDRLASASGRPRRRVKRYLSDVGLRGMERAGWPVVVAGDDVVWIPGVRRSDAATVRSGRPGRLCVCERLDR
jgi:tRNA(Ile)-lysidine synthase